MVDAFDDELRGGTGRIADWEFARAASRDLPGLFLAGGLSPANVGEAIAKVRPKAVDAIEELEETARLYLLLHGRLTRYLNPEQVADLKRRFP